MKPGFIRIFYLIYLCLLVYASLVPFDFFSEVNFDNEFYSFWNHWPFNINSRISGSDILSNIILYIPLGFLITLEKILSNNKKIISFLFAVLFCSTISFSVESIQMFSQFRISSASDWLFNTLSGGLGSLAALYFGQNIWNILNKWLNKKNNENKGINFAIVILLVLFALDAFTPFLPSILLKDIWRSLKNSEFSVLQGFLMHPWHWWIIKILLFTFLTIIIFEGLRKKASAMAFVFMFAIVLETGKIFIYSRYFNIANIFIALGGVCFGGFILAFFYKKISLNQKLSSCIAFILIYIFYIGWHPFNFELEIDLIVKKIPSLISWLPFYDYALGAELNHAALFLKGIVLQFLLIFILKLRFGWFGKSRKGVFGAVILSSTLAVLQEGGQFFIPSRTPSPADIYCFAIGGGLCAGLIKNGRFNKRKET